MSSVDGSKDCPARRRGSGSIPSPALFVIVAVVTGLGVALPGPTRGEAQELPSADELESEESASESPFDETSESGDQEESSDEGSESEAAAEGEEGSQPAEGDEQAAESPESDGGESAESTGDESPDSGPADTSGSDEQASTETAVEGADAPEGDQKEGADESPPEESSEGADKQAAQTDDEKRGEIINTETDTETEVEGHGAVEGDVRWVQSGLNAYGTPGLQHAASAKPEKSNTYHVGVFGEVTGGSNMIRAGDQNTFVAGRLLVHAQPIEYFSANFSLGARNNVNNFGRPNAMLSQGDMSLAIRGHYSPQDYLHLASDLTVDFPTGFGSAGVDFAGTSVTPRAVSTLEFNPLIQGTEFPMAAHLNLGYRIDNTEHTVPDGFDLTRVERFAHGISAFNAIELGLGVEYDLPYVSPFAEWNVKFPVAGPEGFCSGRQPLDCPQQQDPAFASFPDTISFGMRGEPVEQFALHAGVDVSLTARQAAGVPATPPYKIFMGASWNIDPQPRVERTTETIEKTRLVKEESPRGRIVGEVHDTESELPVGGAQVAYPDTERSPQMAGTDNGTFRSYGFKPGETIALEVSHPDYESKTLEVEIEEGEKTMEIALKPNNKKGGLSGTVTDAGGAPIAGATVVADGPETRETTTDSDGKYSLDLATGSYTVGVAAPDYQPTTQTADIQGGQSQTVEVSLEEGEADLSQATVADGKIDIEDRISFASGTANIERGSMETLDAVAARLKARPDIQRLEVAGHTDDVGSEEANMELSEKRADAVVDYLVDQGVSRNRLKANGYGPEQPMVPNISDRNRRMNRRVEFKILE